MRSARRKTLSGVHASQLNNRNQGVGQQPNGEDATFRKTSALDDASAVYVKHATVSSRAQGRNHQGKPNSTQRRHSVYFSSGQTPRVDPRPLGDKAYINSCVRQLIGFLSSRGFEAAISPKTLAAPTAKEFAALSLFLFRQADENFKFGSKTEDDVPTVFKQLRYPFQISKSALYAVGSPHTWPSLLTALTWLVQIFVYEEEAGRNDAKVNSTLLQLLSSQRKCFYTCFDTCVFLVNAASERRTQRCFLQACKLCVSGECVFVDSPFTSMLYVHTLSFAQHFLAGDDAKCEELEREFASAQSGKLSQGNTSTQQLEQVCPS